jgi:hypothetical protein
VALYNCASCTLFSKWTKQNLHFQKRKHIQLSVDSLSLRQTLL